MSEQSFALTLFPFLGRAGAVFAPTTLWTKPITLRNILKWRITAVNMSTNPTANRTTFVATYQHHLSSLYRSTNHARYITTTRIIPRCKNVFDNLFCPPLQPPKRIFCPCMSIVQHMSFKWVPRFAHILNQVICCNARYLMFQELLYPHINPWHAWADNGKVDP